MRSSPKAFVYLAYVLVALAGGAWFFLSDDGVGGPLLLIVAAAIVGQLVIVWSDRRMERRP